MLPRRAQRTDKLTDRQTENAHARAITYGACMQEEERAACVCVCVCVCRLYYVQLIRQDKTDVLSV